MDLKENSVRKIETPEFYVIKAMLADKNSVLWVATNGLGIFKIDLTPVQFLTLSKRKGNLSFLSVRAILPVGNGQLLVGGLYVLNVVNLKTLSFMEVP